MPQSILDAVRTAVRDRSQMPLVASRTEPIVNWEDQQIDQLLVQLATLEEELLEAEITDFGDQRENDSTIAGPSASPSTPHADIDRALQPIIHHLVVREMRRKLSPHLSRKSASGIPGQESRLRSEGAPPVVPQVDTPEAALTSSAWSESRFRMVQNLYQLSPPTSELRSHLLRWVATAGGPKQMELWLDLICNDPPENRLSIGLAFAPLMQANFLPSSELLAGLISKATSHSQIAPAVFDLFNYYVRNKKILKHPATARLNQLAELLGQLAGQLGKIEEGQFPEHYQARQINQLVSDSVALIVALCDTFALTNYQAAIPKLYQALQLRHRRVQTEAAAALARLKDEAGKQALIALADQPIARLRVLAYAEELGFKQEISLELQGDIALAESHLAIWLSEPDQMGLAPSDLELIDQRLMYWPSYEQPMQCYLFKYSYGRGSQSHSNIGLCGPMTYAFAADLRHLPVDEMYAAFAGWQTTHDEIYQMSPARAQQMHPSELRRLERCLQEEALEEPRIQTVGSFFGELVLVASAIHEGQAGTLIVDGHDSTWFEIGNPEAPIDWRMAYSIWRGKQLLNRFNNGERGDAE